MKKIQILMINDRVELNYLYRNNILDLLKKEFIKVYSCGLFDKKKNILFMVLKILNPKVITVSSNLKSNIFSLIFFWKRGTIILNGMGRYRHKIFLRTILLILFKLNWKKLFIIQSYADFRFFKRRFKKNFFWIPGSGGTKKKRGLKKNFLLIQRDDKIRNIFLSVNEFLKNLKSPSFFLIGCKNDNKKKIKLLFKKYKINFIKRQNPKNIFLKGGSFIQPTGYGEGFPHSLADAIVSNLDIYIHNKEFLRYGLHKLGGKKIFFSNNWSKLINREKIADEVNLNKVNKKYISLIKKSILD